MEYGDDKGLNMFQTKSIKLPRANHVELSAIELYKTDNLKLMATLHSHCKVRGDVARCIHHFGPKTIISTILDGLLYHFLQISSLP